VNLYWRNILVRGRPRTVLSRDGRHYKEAVAERCILARVKPLSGPVKVTLHWRRPRAIGDLDNHAKAPLDAIKSFAYHDDKQIIELHLYRSDEGEPGVTVTVEAA
jgi:crossover junction endodeoxyribonuclease RusA